MAMVVAAVRGFFPQFVTLSYTLQLCSFPWLTAAPCLNFFLSYLNGFTLSLYLNRASHSIGDQ